MNVILGILTFLAQLALILAVLACFFIATVTYLAGKSSQRISYFFLVMGIILLVSAHFVLLPMMDRIERYAVNPETDQSISQIR